MAQSIPAAAPDKRIVLKTEGGAGAPLQLLIERTDQGWRLHGDAEAVMEAQRLLEAEAHLQDRKADALEAVRNQLEQDQQAMDAGTLAKCLGIKGKSARDAERKARSTLDQLSSRGLLVVEIHATGIGSRMLYRSMGGVSPRLCQASRPSHQGSVGSMLPNNKRKWEG